MRVCIYMFRSFVSRNIFNNAVDFAIFTLKKSANKKIMYCINDKVQIYTSQFNLFLCQIENLIKLTKVNWGSLRQYILRFVITEAESRFLCENFECLDEIVTTIKIIMSSAYMRILKFRITEKFERFSFKNGLPKNRQLIFLTFNSEYILFKWCNNIFYLIFKNLERILEDF